MSSSKDSRTPLLEEVDGPIIVGLINHVAESIDVAALSLEAALLLAVVAERVMKALWSQYPTELMTVYQQALLADDDDNSDDDDEPDTGGQRH